MANMPSQSATHEAEARLNKATLLADRISDMCDTPLATVKRHPAWRIVDSVINQCLSYDAAVNDPSTMVLLGRRLDVLVETTAAKILHLRRWSPASLAQARMAKEFGGCNLRSAEERCHTAYLVSVNRLGPHWPRIDSRHHYLATTIATAIEGLRALGITLDQHALPHSTSSPPHIPFNTHRSPPQCPPKTQTLLVGSY